jgi:hypothetical protein
MLNAFEWHTEVSSHKSSIGQNAYLLFELFSVNKHLGDKSESGWPRPDYFRHTILMGAGCGKDADRSEDEEAQRLLRAGPRKVIGVDARLDIPPTGMEEFHDPTLVSDESPELVLRSSRLRANSISHRQIFGDHLPRLQELKKRYDPTNRLNSMITAVS